jgi:hypothetical protein
MTDRTFLPGISEIVLVAHPKPPSRMLLVEWLPGAIVLSCAALCALVGI